MTGTQDIDGGQRNRLAKETSPYLLQHAGNPVDWYPWGEEAFARARAENKLVLVSIGYSSCHWCHVMERECFENTAIAALMNERYVCVKVDREERPDVDQVYMTAVQLMTGHGGWPLNCFTLPDGRPAYGGTYFPPSQWPRVLTELASAWANDPGRVTRYAEQLRKGVAGTTIVESGAARSEFERTDVDAMVLRWEPHLDKAHGGPDKVPKFPMPNNYEFLLRYARLTERNALDRHVELTLDRMALGGIFDRLGGGFARYSTDALWKVPHFEKMLYDNAQLISLYSQAYQAFGKPLYRAAVERTIAFIQREMTSPEGAFHSAIDADSEGEEGLYYVWTREQLESVLGAEYDLAAAYYDIGGEALWEHGRNILQGRNDHPLFADEFGIGEVELRERMAAIDSRLLAARDQRPRPALDDKSLTSWNALMVKALCDAYEVFGEATWKSSAMRAMELLLKECRRSNGGLWHSYKDGTATINGYLEDYSFMIEALIALYGVTFQERWLHDARALAEHAIRHFHDPSTGLFHFTSDLDPPLIARPMETQDNVIPASNSSMAKGLFLLGTLFDDQRYRGMSTRMLSAVLPRMAEYPTAHSNWAQLLLMRAFPFHEIAITGPEATRARMDFAPHHLPNRLFLGSTERSELPLLKDKTLHGTTIFVCVEKHCNLPVHTVQEALVQIR